MCISTFDMIDKDIWTPSIQKEHSIMYIWWNQNGIA